MVLPRKLLITGASGFTGRHACSLFCQKGYEVYGMIRRDEKLPEGVQPVVCDVTNAEEVEQVIEAIVPDLLLHLAGQNDVKQSWQQPFRTFQSNSVSTLYLLEAVRNINPACKTLIVGSMLDAKSLVPNHPYGVSKHVQVEIARAYGQMFHLPIIIAKPSNLVGPNQRKGVCGWIANELSQAESDKREVHLTLSSPLANRDFIDVRDAVNAYAMLFQKGLPNGTYEVGSGKETSLQQVAEEFKRISHVPMTFTWESEVVDVQGIADPTALKQLGWIPTRTIATSIEEMVEALRGKRGASSHG
ncbi:UDP-2-acetamido-2,6-dideoxy-hexulose 4-reductase [Pontibacillus halophilus JSM 076056 = DSM 19796]|uniref:UDP-2-acetamido-2,6-dideoxy-hexulose 4-reductase n=1 Tax=Pontibacillus halophilus JSM 076056 = DSM 19796 TaxID=1385510 RepID=A0A0A5GMH7_9BACI|nr:GDP-mannose 4,6-dehydratase [Pontibacillus halophilus]KGX92428.1 UDP-2-acetamido-2,6-dideoxy-hexulose 4-reductase [Pontibacillus halophilus JSM 076056 = DSM 19796]